MFLTTPIPLSGYHGCKFIKYILIYLGTFVVTVIFLTTLKGITVVSFCMFVLTYCINLNNNSHTTNNTDYTLHVRLTLLRTINIKMNLIIKLRHFSFQHKNVNNRYSRCKFSLRIVFILVNKRL